MQVKKETRNFKTTSDLRQRKTINKEHSEITLSKGVVLSDLILAQTPLLPSDDLNPK